MLLVANVSQIMDSSFPAHIFRTYDIRGLLAEVTPEIAKKVGQALVHITGAKTVIVGRDMRETSPELAKAAIDGITSMGANVLDIGMCTTPLFGYSVRNLDVQAGLMVTASHNPPEYNGMKFADKQGLPISGKKMLPEMDKDFVFDGAVGTVSSTDALEQYLRDCLQWPGADGARGAKVIADFGNGMGAMTIRPLAEKLGIELIEMFAEPDARFPNHEANPAKEETLRDIQKKIVEERADFGIALDGDADRIAFIDNEGKTLNGDLALVTFAEDVLSRSPGARVVVSPNQSWTTMDTIRELGGELIESPIGRTLMIQKMVETDAAVSGEVSSHFFFKEFGCLEAPEHAFVRMLSIWKKSGKTFADFVRPLRKYANSGEVNFEIPDKEAVLELLRKTYVDGASSVNTMDGIRCDFGRDWWFIARPSNNEPLLRLTIEALSQDALHERVREMSSLLESIGCTLAKKH